MGRQNENSQKQNLMTPNIIAAIILSAMVFSAFVYFMLMFGPFENFSKNLNHQSKILGPFLDSIRKRMENCTDIDTLQSLIAEIYAVTGVFDKDMNLKGYKFDLGKDEVVKLINQLTTSVEVLKMIQNKKCHADEDGINHNACSMMKSCNSCPSFR